MYMRLQSKRPNITTTNYYRINNNSFYFNLIRLINNIDNKIYLFKMQLT